MITAQIVLLVGTFLIVSGAVWAAMIVTRPDAVQKRIDQINRDTPRQDPDVRHPAWVKRLERFAKPLARLSAPQEGWENSPLRLRFIHAGWRSPEAVPVYFGTKTALAVGLPLLLSMLLAGRFDASQQLPYLTLLFLSAAIGFYLPNLVLRMTIKRRQRDIFETFPDSLDLIMVCVEAGLGLDAAVLRVVEEMHGTGHAIAEEYELLTLELRAGLSREKALRNLAMRTGVDDVDMLVSMLIQADRFGTSIADSLRVHADMLRTKRHTLAEERAAKIATKLLFPLIFCIFPALLVVLLGPALIQLLQLMSKMTAN